MRRNYFAVVLLVVVSTLCVASSSYVVPTTTLAAQISNNTSAANSFTKQSNDNRGAGNTSKVDIHSLLYSGTTTKIYAHMVLWFGQSDHMNNGYSETNPAQVQSQIDDMVSRGIDGVIIDWYGPGNSIDKATQLVMAAAESHPGFTFAIMIDQGAIEWYSCPGCSPQQALESELQYIEHTYFPSPAYMTLQGQPVVTNFNVSLSYPSVDWNSATATLSTRPTYIFQNNNGFTQSLTDGSYAWVMPTASNYGLDYLSSFYDKGMSFPSQQTIGATYKGFNDTLASWGSNRIMSQQCGQTWLQTFAEINGLYSSGKQLPELQLVTWNDYEEATEIESGIDNCFSLSSSVAANDLQWSISGNENTIDHYTVYISTDGQNLMSLTDITPGVHSLNLCGFSIPTGSYQMFVQAVGKPTLANQMSGSVQYNSTCPASVEAPAPGSSSISFSASPSTLTVGPGQSGAFTVTAKAQSGSSNGAIALSCSNVPSDLRCSFSPASITPGSGSGTSTLTISAAAVSGVKSLPAPRKTLPIYAGFLLSFGITGCVFFGNSTHRRKLQGFALVALLGIGMVTASCGGKNTEPQTAVTAAAAPISYTVTINGNSSSSKVSTTVNVVVQ